MTTPGDYSVVLRHRFARNDGLLALENLTIWSLMTTNFEGSLRMQNLLFRIITALVLLPIVIVAVLSGGIFLKFLLGVVSLLCTFEIAGMVLAKSKKALWIAFLSWAALFLPVVFSSTLYESSAAMFVAFFIINLIFLFKHSINASTFEKFSTIFYFSFYIIMGINCLFWLQNDPILGRSNGLGFIFLACIATWGNDTCAYFGGRLFGKHTLMKSVSAKKTWEGFIFGSLGSIALIFAIKAIFNHYGIGIFGELRASDILWVALPAIALAPLGDLIESRFKRIYQIKDSSNILPGHGGILDRIDGLILVLPWTALYAFIIRPLC